MPIAIKTHTFVAVLLPAVLTRDRTLITGIIFRFQMVRKSCIASVSAPKKQTAATVPLMLGYLER